MERQRKDNRNPMRIQWKDVVYTMGCIREDIQKASLVTFKPRFDTIKRLFRRPMEVQLPNRRVNLLRNYHSGVWIHPRKGYLLANPITSARAGVAENATEFNLSDDQGTIRRVGEGFASKTTILEQLKHTKQSDWFVFSLRVNQYIRDRLIRLWNWL
jgi:hypothetical protein